MPAQSLFTQFTTTKDVESFKIDLERLKREMYTASVEVDKCISNIIKAIQKEALVNYLIDKKVDTSDAVRVENAIEELIEEISKMPVINLISAVIPTQSLLVEMLEKIESQTGEKMIFRMYTSPDIIGGAVFEYNGIEYRDTVEDKLLQLTTK